jgi:hypothetical protein
MFFVGSTGQLITLILTVCLPFVLLVSGKQKAEVQLPANYMVVSGSQIEIVSIGFDNSYHCEDSLVDEQSNCQIFADPPLIQIIPNDNLHVRWKSIYSTSSGNKAPPVFNCYSC